MLSEVKLVTLGVSNLDQACRFYTEALGYKVVDAGPVDPALAPVWRFAPDLGVRFAIMAADDSGLGRLRLLGFDRPGTPVWEGVDRYRGTGFYALNFRCRDALDTMRAIASAGGTASQAPSYWEVSDEVAVRDSMNQDPDGIHLDVFSYERGGHLRGPLETEVSVLQTIAIATRDVPRSAGFYKALGFIELFDRILDFPELQDLLGTDRPVRIHNANLRRDADTVPGRVEMFAYLDMDGVAPVPLRDVAVPPNPGILSISLASDDLDADLETLAAAGAEPVARTRCELPGVGQAAVASVFGPDGELLEISQAT